LIAYIDARIPADGPIIEKDRWTPVERHRLTA
jgi:hypothetical protein